MFLFVQKRAKLFAALGIMCMLQSCATYHQRIQGFHEGLAAGDFSKANNHLDKIGLLKTDRNRVLYLMEKGRTLHLMQQYDSSNRYLNEADLAIEDSRKNVKDLLTAQLLNPMLTRYQPEDFETFMLSYYKALNYCYLGNMEAALVEVRRITLQSNRQADKSNGQEGKYTGDVFAMMLQGMIYEKANDINNAFIAYRNAADVFINNGNEYYGVKIPLQLKKDVLRTASKMGFSAELGRYEKIFDLAYTPAAAPEGGEAIIFWESGMAPVKDQQTIQFNIIAGDGGYFFRDNSGLYNYPFDQSMQGYNNSLRLSDLQMFAVALPKYVPQPMAYSSGTISLSGAAYSFEKAENITVTAEKTLQQRFGKELATALSRMALKKLSEFALTPKRNDKQNKTKKEKNEEAARELLALGVKIFNRATEKADTRNWQSLPGAVFYTRIPLDRGINTLTVTTQGNGGQKKDQLVVLEGKPGIQFYSLYSMR
jgi:uncharacterized protein